MQLPLGHAYREYGIGDKHDRCFTPPKLAAAVVSLGLRGLDLAAPLRLVEPSVGGGAVVREARRQAPNARIIGVDIDPRAVGFAMADEAICGDWEEEAGHIGVVDAILGNVPFAHAIPHVLAARDHHPRTVLAVIMPLGYLGVKEWQPVFDQHPLAEVHPILGRPWPAKVRETALWVWRPEHAGPWWGMPPIEWE